MRNPRPWYIVGLVVAAVLTLFFLLLFLGGVIDAVKPDRSAGVTRGGGIAVAVVGLALAVGSIVWAVHLEHRLRAHLLATPGGWPALGATASPPIGYRRQRRLGHHGPGALIAFGVVLVPIFAGLLVGTITVHADASKSAYVQAHGIALPGTVTDVHNHFHSSKSGGYYTADITVSLQSAVSGQSTTTVRYPGRWKEGEGVPVEVLVDPHEPGYAELPGAPSTRTSSWVVLAVVTGLLGIFALFLIVRAVRLFRRGLPPSRLTSPGGPNPVVGLAHYRMAGYGRVVTDHAGAPGQHRRV